MASTRNINFQLVSEQGTAIAVAGGEVMICTAGSPRKISLTDSSGGALSNPVAFTRGQVQAEVPKANTAVDLYIRSPTGHFRAMKNWAPGSSQSIHMPIRTTKTDYIVPFSYADSVAATEKDSGFDLVTDAMVLPQGVAVDVTALDAGITIEAGILSSESGGDADGFIDVISLGAVATVPTIVASTTGVIASATTTIGLLLADITNGTNADDRGYAALKPYRCNGTAKSISYTLLAGADTGEGFIILPVDLGAAQATAASPV